MDTSVAVLPTELLTDAEMNMGFDQPTLALRDDEVMVESNFAPVDASIGEAPSEEVAMQDAEDGAEGDEDIELAETVQGGEEGGEEAERDAEIYEIADTDADGDQQATHEPVGEDVAGEESWHASAPRTDLTTATTSAHSQHDAVDDVSALQPSLDARNLESRTEINEQPLSSAETNETPTAPLAAQSDTLEPVPHAAESAEVEASGLPLETSTSETIDVHSEPTASEDASLTAEAVEGSAARSEDQAGAESAEGDAKVNGTDGASRNASIHAKDDGGPIVEASEGSEDDESLSHEGKELADHVDADGDAAPPTVRITFNGQDFVLFSAASPPAFQAVLETSDANSPALASIPAPRLAVPEELFWQPLEGIFNGLRVSTALGDFLEEGTELVMQLPDLDMTIHEVSRQYHFPFSWMTISCNHHFVSQDNVYTREISLEDIFRLHVGCNLLGTMHVTLTETSRLISRYNALAAHVASMAAEGVEEEAEATAEAEIERDEEDELNKGEGHEEQEKAPEVQESHESSHTGAPDVADGTADEFQDGVEEESYEIVDTNAGEPEGTTEDVENNHAGEENVAAPGEGEEAISEHVMPPDTSEDDGRAVGCSSGLDGDYAEVEATGEEAGDFVDGEYLILKYLSLL